MATAVCIWQPKYKTRQVLVATTKVHDGKNYVFFSSCPSMPDLYSFDGNKAKECEIVNNGKIGCYGIPMDSLTNEGTLPQSLVPMRDAEDSKFREFQNKTRKK